MISMILIGLDQHDFIDFKLWLYGIYVDLIIFNAIFNFPAQISLFFWIEFEDWAGSYIGEWTGHGQCYIKQRWTF